MNSNNPVAALAACKFLMSLNPKAKAVDVLFSRLSYSAAPTEADYERREHQVFSQMPPNALRRLMGQAIPRIFQKGDLICRDMDLAESCFFPIYGTIEVELNIDPKPVLGHGSIVGEFGLWIPGISRTATLKAKDDCMLLEVNFRDFEETVKAYSGVQEAVTAMIKQRILTYIVQSRQFFPDISAEDRETLRMNPSLCEKYPRGSRLDLTNRTYILFNGRVRIASETGHLDVSAPGRFDHERAVGIVTQQEDPLVDGREAEVIEDSVLVSFMHEALLRLQQQYSAVEGAWAGLWGRRRTELKRKVVKSAPSTETAAH